MKTPGSVEVEVAGLTIDPFTNMPIVVLRDPAGNQQLPIWIGLVEASAIATQLEKIELARPMTHDLLKTLMEKTGTRLTRVEVATLKDDTFFAELHLLIDGKEQVLDSRPSDAIAIALRTNAPIFVSQEVLAAARRVDEAMAARTGPSPSSSTSQAGSPLTGQPPSKWAEILAKLSPEEFGKFKM